MLFNGCAANSVTSTETAILSEPEAVTGASLSHGPMLFPDGFMTSVKSYGAVGDGITDDTAAIQAALADGRFNASTDYFGRPKALYFPAGTYLVHDTLQWIGCCVTLQGTGPNSSIIRLAPGSSGFGSAGFPKAVILTPLGNTSFHQNIWDLGIVIGSGNSGATALNYVSNNVGSVHDVRISSEDRHGHAGIDLTRQWAGPLLIRNAEIDGFDFGVDLKNAEYSSTFEAITLANQNITGIRNSRQSISIRGLVSTNSVPALTNQGGMVVLLDGSLNGGSPATNALETDSTMYLHNVSSTGYLATLLDTSDGSPSVTKGNISQIVIGARMTLTGSISGGSLKIGIAETPSFTSSALSDWQPFVPRWSGDSATLQTVVDGGKHTLYFPSGAYNAWHDTAVVVPDTVTRIVGFSSVLNSAAGGDGIRFVVNSNSTTPLIIEQFGYGLKINHLGSRPIAIKDAGVADYQSSPGAGSLYLEDVGMPPFTIQKGQSVWARQLNSEFNGTKITNLGGSLWILGLKTEQAGTVIDTQNGGRTELLGGLIYPAAAVPSTDVAFRSTDSSVTYMYAESVYCKGCGYSVQVQETRSGVTKQETSTSSSYFRMPLFVGYQ